MIRRNVFLVTLCLALMVGFIGFTSKAHAISNKMFDAGDYSGGKAGDQIWSELSLYGADNSIDSPASYTKLFLTSSTAKITVWDASSCGTNNEPDGTTASLATFKFWNNTSPSGGTTEQRGSLMSTSVAYPGVYCRMNANSLSVTLTGLNKSTIPGHEQYYVAYVTGEISHYCSSGDSTSCYTYNPSKGCFAPSCGAINAFQVIGPPESIAGFYPSNNASSQTDARGMMTLQKRIPYTTSNRDGGPMQGDIHIKFAPPCSLGNSTRTITIKWGNLEYPSGVQPDPPSFKIIARNRDTGAVTGTPLNVSSEALKDTSHVGLHSATFNGDSNHTYDWVWHGIDGQNALQVWVPYDSAEFGTNCEQTKATCKVTAPSIVYKGDTFSANFYVSNTGTVSLPTTTGFFSLGSAYPNNNNNWGKGTPGNREPIPGPTPSGYGPLLLPGQSAVWTDSFTANLAPGTYAFAWQVLNDSVGTRYGDACSKTITVKIPTNTPYLRVTNNDVWAGAAFKSNVDATSCQVSTGNTAQINTTNLITPDDNTMSHLLIARIYRAALGRAGGTESNEIDYWANAFNDPGIDGSVTNLVTAFIGSTEYKTKLNALGHFDSSQNVGLVTQAYQNALGRTPEGSLSDTSTGLGYWVSLLNNAKTDSERNNVINTLIVTLVKSSDSSSFGLYNGKTYSYGGSGSEYGAFSTGGVLFSNETTGFTGRNGITRDLSKSITGLSSQFDLTFPNVKIKGGPGNYELSSFDGSDYAYNPTSSLNNPLCLPDYYNDATQSPTPQTSADTSTASNTKKIIIFSGSTINGLDIASGADLTIIKKGDLTINGDITYASKGNLTKPTHFTLIVEGNLNITSSANQLDGTYIVQPDPTITGTGTLDTCSDIDSYPKDITDNLCGAKQLKVNGQVIAQKIKFHRLFGSIGYSNGSTWTDSVANTCLPLNDYNQNNAAGYNYMYGANGAGQVSKCAAELFKFDPSVYVGAASSNSTTGGGGSGVQSRQELPPIY